MRFHGVHGANVLIDEGGKRATRLASFCDAVTFSAKPVAVGSRVSLQLTSNESWTGALRLGLTTHDPAVVSSTVTTTTSSSTTNSGGAAITLPRFSWPDLASRQGYWIRPLPERWIAHCTKLTFYVNAQGHFQLFVDSDYKGALFSGLPSKERLWLIVDLYGITVSAKFVAPCSSAPVEVVARGPDAVRAYKQACAEGSVPLYRTRLYIVGCPGAGKTSLKRALLNSGSSEAASGEKSPVDAVHCCRTSEKGDGAPWTALPTELLTRTPEDVDQNWVEPDVGHISDAEYHQAVALNVVREMTLQQRKRQHQEDRRRLLGSTRSSVKGQGVLRYRHNHARHAGVTEGSAGGAGQHGVMTRSTSVKSTHTKDASMPSSWEGMPQDLPVEVVALVERLLKEAESKQDLDARETEKGPRLTSSSSGGGNANVGVSVTQQATSSQVTFMIWDFDGLPRHFITHQAFYSAHGIYLLLFDLTRDLNEPIHVPDQTRGMEDPGNPLSTIDYVHQWLTSIHVSAARTHQDGDYGAAKDVEDVDTSQLLPTVILVGTHRSRLRGNAQARNNTISEKFTQLRDTLRNKAYGRHVLPMYFAVDCCGAEQSPHVAPAATTGGVDGVRRRLRRPRGGPRGPTPQGRARGGYLEEIGRQEGIENEDGFHSVVHFLHQQGKLVCFSCQHRGTGVGVLDSRWDGIVILRPQWFLDALYKLVGSAPQKQTCWEDVPKGKKEPASYRISYKQLRSLWSHSTDQLETLVAVLSSLDILVAHYERIPSEMSLGEEEEAFCVVPWLANSLQTRSMALGNSPSSDALVFFIDFAGLLPVGFFTRLVVRLLRWCDWREATFVTGFATIPLDRDNDLLLKLHQTPPSQNRGRIQVVIQRTSTMENWMGGIPQPSICEKVVHLIEAEIEALRELWYNRLCFKCFVTCPCKSLPCALHSSKDCQDQNCLHFLPLDECLHRKVVYCDYRRVQTEFVRRHFPYASFHGMRGYSAGLRRASSATAVWDPDQPPLGFSAFGWEERFGPWEEPPWLRDAAKLLESGNTGRDWLALAKRLGYTDKELSRFVEETSPGVALLRDWRESNGATRYCIDVLISCLQQISRHDVARLIQDEMEPESLAPPVFISYQWDAQEVVLNIRQHLEFSGFPCWMDVGQVGGGDSLYGKIYEGISRAKVVLCCLTPRYASSSSCARELSLADVLRKPIVPVMVEPTPWPPPGPLAVVLSALVYVDLCGIGGHGGSGRRADWEMRFQEIVARVAQFLAPPTSAPRPHSNKHRAASLAPLLAQHATASGGPAAGTTNAAASSTNAVRAATPSPRPSFSQANAVRNDDERELQSAASVPMDDDRESDASNPGSPQSWDRPNRVINRVVRCSICAII
ncbi:uncharacterized protein LOC119405388 [Rhipicephalus sanguineus]|uniref:uncharacterized protein LOC119405388 n=1 Tax=Rhipicephalus sanguineus TaxID=34632 RepID=UPI0020C41323|nr:uncharacterized protein LOC119405388 [Rhipicephalus sanguineus]